MRLLTLVASVVAFGWAGRLMAESYWGAEKVPLAVFCGAVFGALICSAFLSAARRMS